MTHALDPHASPRHPDIVCGAVQGKKFSIKGLLSDPEDLLAPTFDGGSMVIFRLAPQVCPPAPRAAGPGVSEQGLLS